ncbi:hypothetical protein Pmani_020828 [Petrolisthes manimaculis]|uniref:Phosphoglycolate phosphatase n=1 Tax=Petrolisthes manimaculis TaxID=1843537 RepID=A0AAE1U645_9EUCA|nr:hypothetical protein Pmani_020828 [Petrolisthes manimaculis]
MAQYLKEINFNRKVYVVGSQALAHELELVGVRTTGVGPERIQGPLVTAVTSSAFLDPEVGAVAVGFDREWSYDKLVKATTYLANPDCLFLAACPDEKLVIQGTGLHLPAGGIMMKSLELCSNRPARVMGKPSLNLFYMLQARYNIQPQKTLIIGDT